HTRCYRDWSSDVCSSDLERSAHRRARGRDHRADHRAPAAGRSLRALADAERVLRAVARAAARAPDPAPAGRDARVRAGGQGARMTPPLATYRLQLGPTLSFDDAARLAPYLAALGISHCYASPVFETSAPDSTHGYDVADHSRFRETLG